MASISGLMRRKLLGIAPDEITFARRGFPAITSAARGHLEHIGHAFLDGYHVALEAGDSIVLQQRLEQVEPQTRGFAYEGATMALALLDRLTPWHRHRVGDFLRGPGDRHTYMVHVGIGVALARLRRRVEPTLAWLDPLLGWLVGDGYGFHEGFFHWQRSFEERVVPDRLTGYALRAFDQGLGRSLWFVAGAEVDRIHAMIGCFPMGRRADLWSGVGLACAYAGGIGAEAIKALHDCADSWLPQVAQGAAFGAKARQRAGNPIPSTDLACGLLCDMPAEQAAEVTDTALIGLPDDGAEPAYEVWRQRIAERFTCPTPAERPCNTIGV